MASILQKKIKILFFPARYQLLKTYIILFLIISTGVRLSFLCWNFSEADTAISALFTLFGVGLFFDIGTIAFFAVPYALYLFISPAKFYGSILDKTITYIGYALGLFIFMLSFFAEFAFWEEFRRRFNFIAVDYLIYTYEVLNNINESYPIPFLVGFIFLLILILIWITKKTKAFYYTFHSTTAFKEKLLPTFTVIITAILYGCFIDNAAAELSTNRYNNELAKAGIYSFFAAFRNNELSFPAFYNTIDIDEAFTHVKNQYSTDQFLEKDNTRSIKRTIINHDSVQKKPNIILICVESLSAKYLKSFGAAQNITPTLDSLAAHGLFFTHLFATGTRTVRGMEAITLSIPPTPGRSIVKRKKNKNLFTVGEVFKQKGYDRNFFYGGDGYFDNMNNYFGGNGFDIFDRGRGFIIEPGIKVKRTNIHDHEVSFENAWGVCDEDIYKKVIQQADKARLTGKPFFDFVMTTSNHRPYTYPAGKIAIPSGTGRSGAIQYTDYAIGQLLNRSKTRPWYKNTIWVIIADHCASSAGAWELDIADYHIPAIIINAPYTPKKIDTCCSQIDIMPTLFGILDWSYTSNFFGKNILKMTKDEERAFVGNYRKLGLFKNNQVMVLSDQNKARFYHWHKATNALTTLPIDKAFLKSTIAYYQVADALYQHGGLKIQ